RAISSESFWTAAGGAPEASCAASKPRGSGAVFFLRRVLRLGVGMGRRPRWLPVYPLRNPWAQGCAGEGSTLRGEQSADEEPLECGAEPNGIRRGVGGQVGLQRRDRRCTPFDHLGWIRRGVAGERSHEHMIKLV